MKKLQKKWQIILYGAAGLGVNMLNLIMGSYMCDALMVEGFDVDVANWTFSNKTLVVSVLWSAMIFLAKVLDGVIDIPFASFTDNLKTRWGKRRPAILIGFIPMILSYIGFLIVPELQMSQTFNSIWCGIMLMLFYSFYTLTMVSYYATFSEIVEGDKNLLTLSNWKTICDVVYFVLGYALIPALVGNVNIRTIAFLFMPLSLTMLIALFMIKEPSTLDADQKAAGAVDIEPKEEHVGMWESLKYSVKNKSFMIWMGIYCALEFGLQMFLTGQNVLFSGPMQLSGGLISIVMACAFAPVPFTLIIYNKIIRQKGIKAAYNFSTLMYCIAMVSMLFCSPKLIPNETVRVGLACVGAVFSAFGTGCFFSINYTIPATIADREKKRTGISHPAMFFAVQGLFSGVATAISTGPIWVNLKKIGDGAFVWVMPIIVVVFCVLSVILTRFMPNEISMIGKENQQND